MSERLSEDLRELLGDDDFLKLVENFGGDRLRVPKNAEGTIVAETLGDDAAAKLVERYGGDYPRIPLAREFRARQYRAGGDNNPTIARKLGMTVTGIEKLFSRRPMRRPNDPRQGNLF